MTLPSTARTIGPQRALTLLAPSHTAASFAQQPAGEAVWKLGPGAFILWQLSQLSTPRCSHNARVGRLAPWQGSPGPRPSQPAGS